MIFTDLGIGPVPKKVRVGFPSHIGTAVGGFGFSTTGGRGGVTAFPLQPVSRTVPQIVIMTPPNRRRPQRTKRFNTRGILAKNLRLIRTTFAAIHRYKLLRRDRSAQLRRRHAIRWAALRPERARSPVDP